MTRTFVVPDLHGHYDLAVGLLRAAGVPPTPRLRLDAGVRCVQLGDLAHCKAASADADAEVLDHARAWFDVVLLGNHEAGYILDTGFKGFWVVPQVGAALTRLLHEGILQPCLLVGDTLLTHAGVARRWSRGTAADTEAAIRWRWRHDRNHPMLTSVGRKRGGEHEVGGILWSDWSESRAPFNQVHGHSVIPKGPDWRWTTDGRFALNLDVDRGRRRLVGIWLDENGQPCNPDGDPLADGFVEYTTGQAAAA